uniref:Uncharacterized protein n=1 Tax=Arundo donax TaxID=35708 RepID=A0A0A9EYH7_ARUDO
MPRRILAELEERGRVKSRFAKQRSHEPKFRTTRLL